MPAQVAAGPKTAWDRVLPKAAWGRVYVWGLVAGLLLVGLLFVINVFAPFTQGSLPRASLTVLVLLMGWGVGLLVPGLFAVPSLRPAGAVGVPATPIVVALALLAVWDVVPSLHPARIAGAFGLLFVFALLCAIPWSRIERRLDLVPASVSMVAIALGGLILCYAVGGGKTDDRLLEAAWRSALGFVFASLLLLIPVKATRRRLPVTLAWAALAQFAAVQGLDPWIDGAASERLMAAGFVLLPVLGLTALTLALLPTGRRGQPA